MSSLFRYFYSVCWFFGYVGFIGFIGFVVGFIGFVGLLGFPGFIGFVALITGSRLKGSLGCGFIKKLGFEKPEAEEKSDGDAHRVEDDIAGRTLTAGNG